MRLSAARTTAPRGRRRPIGVRADTPAGAQGTGRCVAPALSQEQERDPPMDSSISYQQLDTLNGDVLPERAVLSLVTVSPSGGGGSESSAPAPTPGNSPSTYVVSDGQGGTVYYACQTTSSPGSQGLLGDAGLGTPPYSTTTCMPAAATSP